MTKVTIEFADVNSKTTAALVALLNGGKATKKLVEEEEEEEAEEEEEEEVEEEEEEEVEEEETPKAGVATLESVRTAAQKLIAGGKSAKLKAILKKYGAAKVVDVPKAKWKLFLAACKAAK